VNRNVIRFDPQDNRRKRPSPPPPGKKTPQPRFRGLLPALSILLLLFVLGLGVYWMPESSPENVTTSGSRLSGVASVVDGDTIDIHDQRIRLSGFDAPERGRRCGKTNVYQKASLYLSDYIQQQTVTYDATGKNGDRLVATCYVRGKDLGEIMVASGWARDWPRYSQRAYADEEANARRSRAGLWGLSCPDDLWGNRNYN
jgi:endonuclease YncB( thermonuclease family)